MMIYMHTYKLSILMFLSLYRYDTSLHHSVCLAHTHVYTHHTQTYTHTLTHTHAHEHAHTHVYAHTHTIST